MLPFPMVHVNELILDNSQHCASSVTDVYDIEFSVTVSQMLAFKTLAI